jgi:hypothetical protein
MTISNLEREIDITHDQLRRLYATNKAGQPLSFILDHERTLTETRARLRKLYADAGKPTPY